MKKALVTGAPGWLGNTVIPKLLASGYSVRVLMDPVFQAKDLPTLLPNSKELEMSFLDFRTLKSSDTKLRELFQDVDEVFHIAAAQHPKHVSDIYAVNTEATALLAQAAAQSQVKKFIFVSSCSVHGCNPNGTALNESSVKNPRTHYAKSKTLAEEALLKVVKEKGLDAVIIRPGVFYGKNPSLNMQDFMKMIQTKRFPLFGKNGFKRTYVDIEDVADSLLYAAKHGKKGEAYLIGDEVPLSTRELIETLASAMNTKAKFALLPPAVSHASEWTAVNWGKLTNRHFRIGNIVGEFGRDHFFDPAKAKASGFPLKKDSKSGLKEMAQNFKGLK